MQYPPGARTLPTHAKVQNLVIDKNGIIRFKSVGYLGSDDKLVEELSIMIEMANSSKEKGV